MYVCLMNRNQEKKCLIEAFGHVFFYVVHYTYTDIYILYRCICVMSTLHVFSYNIHIITGF